MKQLVYDQGSMPIGITNGTYTLVECPHDEADAKLKHYSHRVTKNRLLSLSVNAGMGYIQLGHGIRPRLKHRISPLITAENYCEFDRMWLADEQPTFAESQVIGLLISYLKQAYRAIKFVITYADESAGNKGTTYRATNVLALDPAPIDFYILSTGERVHLVSMYHRHGTRALDTLRLIYPGLIYLKPLRLRQYRFLYIVDRKIRHKYSLAIA